MKRVALKTSPSQPPPDDAIAMKRVASGDIGALGELYDRHAAAILRFVRRASPNEDSEEVVQIVFLRAAAAASSYRETATSAKPWLFGIALRVCSERRRSFKRMISFLRDWGHHARPEHTPESGARLEVERALRGLTDAKRVVVLLAEVEGFKCEDIAEMLSIPVGTVWTRLHSARRELRTHLLAEPK